MPDGGQYIPKRRELGFTKQAHFRLLKLTNQITITTSPNIKADVKFTDMERIDLRIFCRGLERRLGY